MAGRKNMHLSYSFLLKLNEDDRKKLEFIQNSSINATEEIRRFIRELYYKIIKETDDKNM
jgi:hypothetical protein